MDIYINRYFFQFFYNVVRYYLDFDVNISIYFLVDLIIGDVMFRRLVYNIIFGIQNLNSFSVSIIIQIEVVLRVYVKVLNNRGVNQIFYFI